MNLSGHDAVYSIVERLNHCVFTNPRVSIELECVETRSPEPDNKAPYSN